MDFSTQISWQKFQNIAETFMQDSAPDTFLLELFRHNRKLAETLLLFQTIIRQNGETGVRQAFSHYVINTPEADVALGDDMELPGGVFQWAKEYSSLLGIEATQIDNGTLLRYGTQTIPCDAWTEKPGKKAAEILRLAGIFVNGVRYQRGDVIPSRLFAFDEQSGHTLENAIVMADLSALVYNGEAFARQQSSIWGFNESDFRWIENPESDTQAFVLGRSEYAVLGFCGTNSLRDWGSNLSAWKTNAPGGVGRVHAGFNHALSSIWKEIQSTLSKLETERPLVIIGHSLGGALAQLAAHRLTWQEERPLHAVYIYGAPNVGNQEFADLYNTKLGENTYHHINDRDVVTRITPGWLGFAQTGTVAGRYVFGKGHDLISEEPEIVPSGMKLNSAGVADFRSPKNRQIIEDEFQPLLSDAVQHARGLRNVAIAEALPTYENASLDNSGKFGELVNDHFMGQYVFKFACAIVDDKWRQLQRNSA